jgi:hypothetical protein
MYFPRLLLVISVLIFKTASLQASDIKIDLNISSLKEKGIQIDSAIAKLEGNGNSDSITLNINYDQITGSFVSNDSGIYELYIRLYRNDTLVCSGSCTGELQDEETIAITGSFINLCRTTKLLLNWGDRLPFNVKEMTGYCIDSSKNLFNTMPLPLFDSVVKMLKGNGLRWYIPMPVNYSILDSNYIPMIHYTFGDYRNPVTTCQTAFGFYNLFTATGDSFYLNGFRSNLNWLMENHDSVFYFRYDFKFSHTASAKLNRGWISALAQGEALGVMSTAYYMTGDSVYLDAANRIFKTLYSNYDTTWCVFVDHEGYYWAEEYPNNDICHVLNGNVATLWAILQYYTVSGDEFARRLFSAGMRTLVDHYPIWSVPGRDMSYYCLHKKEFTSYHASHQRQLLYFGQLFGINTLFSALECFTRGFTSTNTENYQLPSQADSLQVQISNTARWTMISPADWLTPERYNDTLLQVNVDANPSLLARKDTLLVLTDYAVEKLVIIFQEGRPNGFDTNNEALSRIFLYPNPADEFIHVRMLDYQGELVYSIYSTTGALLSEGTFAAESVATIDISDLPAGIYLMHLRRDKTMLGTIRFIRKD